MIETSNEALFRFAVVSHVRARMLGGEARAQAVRNVALQPHPFAGESARHVSVRTLYRWLKRYEQGGIQALEPTPRDGRVELLDNKLLDFLEVESRRDREASVPELIRRARELGVVAKDAPLDRVSVWRALRRRGVSLKRPKQQRGRDTRRFAYPHRMDMVLCDGKYFRAGRTRSKRLALSFLDDATRYVLHAVVGTSESAELFLNGLFLCISKFGWMTALYLDRGPGFIAEATRIVTANLDIHLILGEAAYPEGHGKIERYNRTQKDDVLRVLDGRADVDPDCGALSLRLRHYTERVYAHRPHEALRQDTPHQRFFSDPRPLRFLKDQASLAQAFEIHRSRRVSHDHAVPVDGVVYEMPRGTAGQRVTLHQRVLDGSVWFVHEGRLIRLHPVDLEKNARDPRAKTRADGPADTALPHVPSAAEMAFDRDYSPVVSDDGGCHLDPLDPGLDDCPDSDEIPF